MNLLAHLHLSDGLSTAAAAGNVLADYVRRVGAEPIDDEFRAGMRVHQAIDVFAEHDEHHRAARRCIGPSRRRLAGVIVDVAFDHCLSQQWSRFAEKPLEPYVAERMDRIQAYVQESQSPLSPLVDRAVEQGWLLSYTTIEGVRTTFRRVSGRSRAAQGLLGAEEEIERHRDCLEHQFQAFYPRLVKAFARKHPV
jgi:acyl carrier protein phosphodiesterase